MDGFSNLRNEWRKLVFVQKCVLIQSCKTQLNLERNVERIKTLKLLNYRSTHIDKFKSDPVATPDTSYKYFLTNELPLLGYVDNETTYPIV